MVGGASTVLSSVQDDASPTGRDGRVRGRGSVCAQHAPTTQGFILNRGLSPRRAVALGGVLAAVIFYDAGAGRLPGMSEAGDVAFVAVVLMPATAAIIWLALPAATARWLLPATLAVGVLAIVLEVAGLDSAFNATKVVAYTLLGFVFLEFFQELSWLVFVALVIPWVDAISVWRGPTNVVVTKHPGIFDRDLGRLPAPG